MSITLATKGIISVPTSVSGVQYINICPPPPELESIEFGTIFTDANYYIPSTRADSEDETPGMRSDVEELEPDIRGEDLRPSLRAFPEP